MNLEAGLVHGNLILLIVSTAHYDSNQPNMVGPSHAKLLSLFSVLNYCLYSRREKLMVSDCLNYHILF